MEQNPRPTEYIIITIDLLTEIKKWLLNKSVYSCEVLYFYSSVFVNSFLRNLCERK